MIKRLVFSFCAFFLVSACNLYLYSDGWLSKPLVYESLVLLSTLAYRGVAFYLLTTYFVFFILIVQVVIYLFMVPSYLIIEDPIYRGVLFALCVPVLGVFRDHRALILGLIVALPASAVIFVDKIIMNDKLATSIIANKVRSAPPRGVVVSPYPVYSEVLSASNENTILVVWESLGVPSDPEILNEFLERNPRIQYSIIEFEGGSTLTAEFRFLCGVEPTRDLEELSCLPERFPTSASFHGNVGSYFNRYRLYHDFGFKEVNFRGDLNGLDLCDYAYRAVCDAAIWDVIYNEASESDFGFLYFLTIDSHFPYFSYQRHAIDIQLELVDSLSRLQLLKETCGCVIFVVGDHPPPVASGFLHDVIPFFVI